jgi:hypothetical protein
VSQSQLDKLLQYIRTQEELESDEFSATLTSLFPGIHFQS